MFEISLGEPHKEKRTEPPIEVTPGQSREQPGTPGEVNEETILNDWRLHDPEKLRTLHQAEAKLARAFAVNPEPLYKKTHLLVAEKDVPFWRVLDLEESLQDLYAFRKQIPARYGENVQGVAENAKRVRKIMDDYRAWSDTERHESGYAVNKNLFGVAFALRRIAPDRFSPDLLNLTDEEFKLLAVPELRLIWDGMFHESSLAEFDPVRFRRLFSSQYPQERIAEEREYWKSVDAGNRSRPNCSRAWQVIEDALKGGEAEESLTVSSEHGA